MMKLMVASTAGSPSTVATAVARPNMPRSLSSVTSRRFGSLASPSDYRIAEARDGSGWTGTKARKEGSRQLFLRVMSDRM